MSASRSLSLVALTLHYWVLTEFMHRSRQVEKGKSLYDPLSAVLLAEIIKVLTCLAAEYVPAMHRKFFRRNQYVSLPVTSPTTMHFPGNESLGHGRPSSSSSIRRQNSLTQELMQQGMHFDSAPSTPGADRSEGRSISRSGSGLHVNTEYLSQPRRSPSSSVKTESDSDDDEKMAEIASPVTFAEEGRTTSLAKLIFSEGWVDVAFVAALFMIQANIQYVASTHLPATVLQVSYQMKIPATAAASWLILSKSITKSQLMAIAALTFGIVLVNLSKMNPATKKKETESHDSFLTYGMIIGLASAFSSCIFSGIAAVTLERSFGCTDSSSFIGHVFRRVLRMDMSQAFDEEKRMGRQARVPLPSIWLRNLQLSVFGLLFLLPLSVTSVLSTLIRTETPLLDMPLEAIRVYFRNFNLLTWFVVLLQASGGLIGAATIKYAGNVLKCFATSVSILIALVWGYFVNGEYITFGSTFGGVLVVLSTVAYSYA